MNRREVLKLAPIAATLKAGGPDPPAPKGKGRCLVLVNNMSGLWGRDLVEALERGDAAVDTDGCVPLEQCVRIVWIPQGAEFLDVPFTEGKRCSTRLYGG